MSKVLMLGDKIVDGLYRRDEKDYGRNLLINSHFDEPGNLNGYVPVNSNIVIEDSILVQTFTAGVPAARIEKSFYLEDVGIYTFSIRAKINYSGVNIGWRAWVGFGESPVEPVDIQTSEWATYSITFENNDTTNARKIIRLYLPDPNIGDTVEIDWEKLEKGTSETRWSPAPEDIIESLKPRTYPLSII